MNLFKAIGVDDLSEDAFESIGRSDLVRLMGRPIGQGLSESSAKEMGLLKGTPVGVSIIDAHAGGLGMLLWKRYVHRRHLWCRISRNLL